MGFGFNFRTLAPPALISFKASRTSCHTSRSASNLANALPLSFLTIFKYLEQLLEDVRRNVLALCFCIQGQHPKLIRSITNKIDDPESYTPLAYSQQRKNGCQRWQPLMISRNGRDDWIRTSDLTHPKRARYQAAPRPVSLSLLSCKEQIVKPATRRRTGNSHERGTRSIHFVSRFVSCCSSSDNNSRNSAASCFNPCRSLRQSCGNCY